METLKIRVKGFDIRDIASQLMQLSKEQDVNIQVALPSDKASGLALDAITFIAVGSNVVTMVLTALISRWTYEIYKNDMGKKSQDVGRITIYGENGWRLNLLINELISAFRKDKNAFQKKIKRTDELAREHNADQMTLFGPDWI